MRFAGTWLLLVTAILWSIACDDSSPTDSTEECRDYASAFEENGTAFSCSLEQGGEVRLFCSAGVMTRSWRYASLADFVRERLQFRDGKMAKISRIVDL